MAIIGEKQIYSVGTAGYPVINPVWTFAPQDFARMYAGYQQETWAAVAQPLTNLTQNQLPVFFAGSGEVNFSVTGTVEDPDGPYPYTWEDSVEYAAPLVQFSSATESGTWTVITDASGRQWASLGTDNVLGVKFDAEVDLPDDQWGDGAGTISFCQLLMAATIDYQGPDNRRFNPPIVGPYLDGHVMYGDQSVSGPADGTVSLTVNDNPKMILPAANCTSVGISLQFLMHLIYQSNSDLGTIPVSLGSWTWSAATSVVNTGAGWSIPNPTTAAIQPFVEAPSLPLWTGNTTDLQQSLAEGVARTFDLPSAEIEF